MTGQRWARVQPIALMVAAFVILLPAALWGKLHDDEAIYWEIARNIGRGLGPLTSVDPAHPRMFVWHVPLPSYLAAPLAVIWNDIVPVRLLAALVAALGAVAIFRVAERLTNRSAAWVSFLVVITSFHWLRYGGRFYNDAFGFSLFWWAADAHLRRRNFCAGMLLVLAVLARELWLLPAAILGICELWRPTRWRFLAGAAVPGGLFLLWVFTLPDGAADFFRQTAVISGGLIVAGQTQSAPLTHLVSWGKAWIELIAATGIGAVGVVAALWLQRRQVPLSLWAAALLAALTVSVTPGFLANGGFTQYGLMMTGFAAVFGGAGLFALATRLGVKSAHAPVLAVGGLLALQLFAGNLLVNVGAQYGSASVYGLGIQSDRAIIALLRKDASGQTIAGIHGAFVANASRWYWVERHVDRLAQLKPDWIVVYRQWVNLKPDPGIAVTEIGPYVVLHVLDPAALSKAVEAGSFELPGL